MGALASSYQTYKLQLSTATVTRIGHCGSPCVSQTLFALLGRDS